MIKQVSEICRPVHRRGDRGWHVTPLLSLIINYSCLISVVVLLWSGDYCKKTVTINFLDLIADTTLRLYAHCKKAASLEKIFPSKISEKSSLTDPQEAIQFYSCDVLNSEILDEEFRWWNSEWLHVSKENRPGTLKDALMKCCLVAFQIFIHYWRYLQQYYLVHAPMKHQHLLWGDWTIT